MVALRVGRPAATCFVALAAIFGLSGLAGCGGDDSTDSGPEPRVDLIDEAIDAIEAERGAPLELVEVSATLDGVQALVRDEGVTAVAYAYDGALTGPVEPRDDERATFTPDQVDLDPDRVFDGIRRELDDPTIIDLAVRVEGGGVVIDATVASDVGGVILVLLDGQGSVLGTQAG